MACSSRLGIRKLHARIPLGVIVSRFVRLGKARIVAALIECSNIALRPLHFAKPLR